MAVFFEEARRRAAVIADAAACGAISWDRESQAGEMLQPAGYRPAGTWVRAGGWSAGRGRFCWNVLRSVRARFEVLARRLVFDLCPACVSIGMSCVHSRLLCGSGAASCVRSMPGVRFTRQGPLGYNEGLTGSNKRRPHCGWFGKTCGRAIIPIHASL